MKDISAPNYQFNSNSMPYIKIINKFLFLLVSYCLYM